MIAFDREPTIVDGIARFVPAENYTDSFGFQWNRFGKTQIDRSAADDGASETRLFAETAWTPDALDGLDILEAGSGAGRFTSVLLRRTRANIHSFDFSNAVRANRDNNGKVAPERLSLSQASIYDIPYPAASFDKVLCLGVLQHTPDFEASVRALVAMARPGGEIVVDFYEIRHPLTKLHAKYLLRPLTRQMSHERLLGLISGNVDRLIRASRWLQRHRLGALTRFLPLVDIHHTFPKGLDEKHLREWAILDTFDMYAPAFDNPQRIAAVAGMVERAGARVTFAGRVDNGSGTSAVVRAVRLGGDKAGNRL